MAYVLKTANTYRCPTEGEVLRLREKLNKEGPGALTKFAYKLKEIKVKGEVVEEYYVVTAELTIDNEKEPEGNMTINPYEEGELDAAF